MLYADPCSYAWRDCYFYVSQCLDRLMGHLQWESRGRQLLISCNLLMFFHLLHPPLTWTIQRPSKIQKKTTDFLNTSTFRTKPNWIFKKTNPIPPSIHISRNFPGTIVGLVTSKCSKFCMDVSTWVKLISPNIHQTNFKPMAAYLYWIMCFFWELAHEFLTVCASVFSSSDWFASV